MNVPVFINNDVIAINKTKLQKKIHEIIDNY